MRPIFTMGMEAPYVSTTAICRTVLMRLRILSAVAPANVSAQSPPCSRKAFPDAARARRSRRSSTSPANTSGGNEASSLTAESTAARSGHSGCCLIGRERHESSRGCISRCYRDREASRTTRGPASLRARCAGLVGTLSHGGGVDVLVVLLPQSLDRDHDLIGHAAENESVVLHPRVSREIERLADHHPDAHDARYPAPDGHRDVR